jgi:hypothetical protein
MKTLFGSAAPATHNERMATLEKLFPAHRIREPRRTSIPPVPKRPAGANDEIPVGSTVKVNHYRGTVRKIITHVESLDRETGVVRRLPLANPLYEIELDLRARYRWVESALQVYVPQGCKRLRLFSDEFQIMDPDEKPVAVKV